MSGVNLHAWGQNALAFIHARGLDIEFSDWCGGWPSPSVTRLKRVAALFGIDRAKHEEFADAVTASLAMGAIPEILENAKEFIGSDLTDDMDYSRYVAAQELLAKIDDALAAGSCRAKTPTAVEREASQSCGESRNAQSTPLEKNEEKRRGV